MASVRYEDVAQALERFGKRRIQKLVTRTRRKGGPFTGDLMLAIGCRETWLQNIAGDSGHGRGVFQIDDRYHSSWLSKVWGAVSGTYKAVIRGATRSGYVPVLMAGLGRARYVLQQNYDYAESVGVPEKQRLRVAVSGYNAGAGGAVRGWQESHDPDRYTTGGDYAEWVLQARQYVRQYLHSHNI